MLASGLTVYVLMSVPLCEEPDLLDTFGEGYREYQQTTPIFLPVKLWRSQKVVEGKRQ